MDNWRLSKIEEELKKLNLDSVPAETVRSEPKSFQDSNCKPRDEPTEDICGKIVIRRAYRKSSRAKDAQKAAVRRFNEKYDSPNSVSKSDSDTEKSKNETTTTTTTTTLTARSPKPEEFQSSPTFFPPNWNRSPGNIHTGTSPLNLNNGTIREDIQDYGIDDLTARGQKAAFPVEEQQFVFRTLAIPAIPRESESDQSIKDDGFYSRIGPPTAAKTFYSSFRGHIKPLDADENVNPSRIESNHKIGMKLETKETLKPRPSNYYHPPVDPVASHSRSPTIAPQVDLPWTRHDQSPVDTFPEPPPELFHREIYPETRDVREKKIQRDNSQTLSDRSPPSGLSETKVFPKRDNLIVVNANCFPGDQGGSSLEENPVTGQAKEQRRCEYISTEAQEIRHLADSYDTFYPRYGTLKATRRRRNSPTSAEEDPPKCELLPPSGPGLSDEDRNQVEMFYRSHKSRVFAARCEANLYLGSARRHSSVHASRAAATRAMTESSSSPSAATAAENWLPLKRGVPVLVLDTGESRRQRRLHVILAERGSGFVLWRDTVDHLTGYGISPDVGFHTMHLSKDHTKLAGLYFADLIHAGDFYDYLNNLTSDPDDPLLNLSSRNGKKDRKSSTKRKEKRRKSIRREDISTPCCFVHVTKLDRCDVSNAFDADVTTLDS